jgi:hypothetical protein
MELIDFVERLEKITQGAKIDFSQDEKNFLHEQYYQTQGHYFPKSCGSCTYGYKVLLNVSKSKIKKENIKNNVSFKDEVVTGPKDKTQISIENEAPTLEDYRKEYKEKFGKEVSNKYKNNLEWIKSKLYGK